MAQQNETASCHLWLFETIRFRHEERARHERCGHDGSHVRCSCASVSPRPHRCSARGSYCSILVDRVYARARRNSCTPIPGGKFNASQARRMCQRELTASPIKGQTSCDPRHGPGHDSVASLCSKAAVGGPSETKQRPRVPTEHPIQSGARRIPTSVHDGNQFVLGQLSGAAACHDRLRHPLVRALPETRATIWNEMTTLNAWQRSFVAIRSSASFQSGVSPLQRHNIASALCKKLGDFMKPFMNQSNKFGT